ncbi:hypothetical protein O181_071152 [Austropuccinia psidii MF-1]|uniref:Uncharacterized protein n=1 Tax=Austropuccinia psidii MF-1 TaxID=1389203 RepID=A0A9Q3F788_9BASI|nr:hypothetical protein [Austropuccinia psidii MF-1]
MLKMAAYNIWIGVEVGEFLPEGSQVVIGVPDKGLGKRPNIHATKKPTKNAVPLRRQKIPGIKVMKQSMLIWTILIMNLCILKAPPYSMKQSIMKPLFPPQNIQAFQEREKIKHDTMGQDITDIMPYPEPKVSSSPNVQGILLSCIEELGDILPYHFNINQESWKRGLANINRIYKSGWDNLPTNDAHTFLSVAIKVISN